MLKIIPHPDKNLRSYKKKLDPDPTKAAKQRAENPYGTDMYRYLVIGTEEELLKFRAIQRQFYMEDEQGRPLLVRSVKYDSPREVSFTFPNELGEQRLFIHPEEIYANLKQLQLDGNLYGGLVADKAASIIAGKLAEKRLGGATQSSGNTSAPAAKPQAAKPQVDLTKALGDQEPEQELEENPDIVEGSEVNGIDDLGKK